jgi:hypothetical protein
MTERDELVRIIDRAEDLWDSADAILDAGYSKRGPLTVAMNVIAENWVDLRDIDRPRVCCCHDHPVVTGSREERTQVRVQIFPRWLVAAKGSSSSRVLTKQSPFITRRGAEKQAKHDNDCFKGPKLWYEVEKYEGSERGALGFNIGRRR